MTTITNNGSNEYGVNPSISFVKIDRNRNTPITYVVPSNYDRNNIISRPFELDWDNEVGTSSFNEALGVAIDSNNNVYITGYTSGNLDGINNNGSDDAFLVKYDSSGIKQWTQLLGTSSVDTAYGVATDSNNNVYITGKLSSGAFLVKYDSSGITQWTQLLGRRLDEARGVAIDSNNNVYITGKLSSGAFLVKYDSSGITQWTQLLGTSSFRAYGVAIDSNNNVYITGITSFRSDAFLVKYDSSGITQWTQLLSTSSYDYARGVAIDSNNNVYITGYGSDNAFLVKYDSSGIKQWTQLLGTSSFDIVAYGVATDSNNNVYITGYTNINAFLAKYDSSGIEQWTKQSDSSSYNVAKGVAIDSNNNVYITGTISKYSNYAAFLKKYVAPRPITVPTLSWFLIQKTVGDADFQITAPTSNSNGVFTYSSSDTSVATINGTTVKIINAGSSIITASQAETLNYNAVTITATLQVNPAPQQSQTPTIFSNISMRSLFTNNAQVFYKPHSLSTGSGGSGVRNSRHKQRRT